MSQEILESKQSVGDVVGRAIRIYRLNLKSWLPLLIWPTIFGVLGRVFLQGSIGYLPESKDLLITGGLGLLALVGIIVIIITKWILLVRQLAFVRLANGFSDSLEESLSFMSRSQWKVLGVAILVSCIFTAVIILWSLELVASAMLYKRESILAIPSLLGIFFGVVAGYISSSFIYYVMFIVFSGVACESYGLTTLISRGFKLASKAIFRTLYLGFLIGVTVYLVAIPLWLPPLFLIGLDAIRIGPELAMAKDVPIHWQVLSSAWEPIVEMIVWPITFLAYGFFYYDLRLRQEAVDVSLKLDLFSSQAKQEASF